MKMLSDLKRWAGARMRAPYRAAAPERAGVKARLADGRLSLRLRSGDEGQSLVELALILPIMFALITGILSIGMAYFSQQSLSQGVGSAAQHLTTIRQTTTDPCADTLSALELAAPTISPSSLTLKVTMNGTPYTGTSCSGAQSNLLPGVPVTVYATYPCKIGVYGVNFSPSCQLSATVTEYEY
jgi:Flp pilus assembly protein TadG